MLKKKAQVIMLPTEKADGIFQIWNDKLFKPNKLTTGIKSYHLYIVCDDEIKEGDYVINTMHNSEGVSKIGYKFAGEISLEYVQIRTDRYKKVIATTDKNLGFEEATKNYEVGSTGFINIQQNGVLPQPSQGFITKFIKEYNNKNIISDVMVDYNDSYVKGNYQNTCSICKKDFYNTDKLGFVCPDHIYLKTDKNNEITISSVKNSWNKDEVKQLLEKMGSDLKGHHKISIEEYSEWIKNNLN